MKDRERHPPIAQPTEERTADQSTQSASGVSAERPGAGPERQNAYDEDVVARDQRPGEVAPRKYDQGDDGEDPVMPDDDSSLNTKI